MGHNNLQLRRSQKPAGAGKLAMAEVHVIKVRDGELMLVFLARLLPFLGVAESIEGVRAGDVGRVVGDGVRGGADLRACGEVQTRGEGVRGLEDAVEAN